MIDKYNLNKKILSSFMGISMILVSMNIIIFSAPVVIAEGGSPDIHLDEIGFSKEFVDTLSTTLYCPRFEQNSNWETQIILSNPSETDAQLYIYFYDSSGQYIDTISEELNSMDTLEFISLDYNIEDETGSIKISSSEPIIGDVIYYSEYCGAAEPLQSSPSTVLFCPGFYQTTDWNTWISITNTESQSNNIALTYYDGSGNIVGNVADTLSAYEIRYFQPSDDQVTISFGSIIIESTIEDALIGYSLESNSINTKAYSYSLQSETFNYHSSTFLTTTDDTCELVLFNPSAQSKELNFLFYDYEGTQIESINNHNIPAYGSSKIVINDYIDYDCYGSVEIECDSTGVIGYYAHIGSNYGMANSIEITTAEHFYTTLQTYKTDTYPVIDVFNPSSSDIEHELITHNIDEEDEQEESNSGTLPLDAKETIGFPISNGFFGSGDLQIADPPQGGWAEDMYIPGMGGGDGIYVPNNRNPPDSDNDGLADWIENTCHVTYGRIGDPNDPDSDDDGMKDGWEYYKLGALAVMDDGTTNTDYGPNGDPDSDTLINFNEYKYGTHPKKIDSDGDGINDHFEFAMDYSIIYFENAQNNLYLDEEDPFDYGWFNTYTWNYQTPSSTTLEKTLFTTPWVVASFNLVENLKDSNNNQLICETTTTTFSTTIDNSIDHFYDNIETYILGQLGDGIWHYFGLNHKGSDNVTIPKDLDDTCVVQLTLRHNSQYIDQGEPTINYNTHLNYYKNNMRELTGNLQINPGYGGFYTWFDPTRTDICLATNANVILNFLDYNSYSITISESIAWLDEQLKNAANSGTFNNNFLIYYRSPLTQMYMSARALYNYGNFNSGLTTSYIYEYIFDKNSISNPPYQSSGEWYVYTTWPVGHGKSAGYIGNILETALGTCALLYIKKDTTFYNSLSTNDKNQLNTAIDGGISFILNNYNLNLNNQKVWWNRKTFYVGGLALATDYGSEEVTSAICLEALALYNM